MKKTPTISKIRREAKSLEKRLRELYNELDNLMDEAEIAASACNDAEIKRGKQKDFNYLSHVIGCSRDMTELAVDKLQSV